MRIRYKNKRDQYKAEVEQKAREIQNWENSCNALKRELQRMGQEKMDNKEKDKKRLSCNVYCSNCQIAYSALVPNGQSVKESGCAHCGMKDTGFLIAEVIGLNNF